VDIQSVGGSYVAFGDLDRHVDVSAEASTSVPAIFRGAASQTADLQQWVDSSNTVLARITSTGRFVSTQSSDDDDQAILASQIFQFRSREWPRSASRFCRRSTGGQPILVTATSSTGTTIHSTGTSSSVLDEIHLFAYNSDSAAIVLTIQFGGTTSPNNDIKLSIPATIGPDLRRARSDPGGHGFSSTHRRRVRCHRLEDHESAATSNRVA
jgi:hypothetical protein